MSLSPTVSSDLKNATPCTSVQVLAIGPWQEKEFRLALAPIEEATAWQTVSDLNQAEKNLQTGETTPELILLAQPLPGRYRQRHVDRLQSLAPLARIVIVAGSWCEGGMRTGIQLTGVLRLYWHELAPWWKSAQTRVAAGLCPPWSLPADNPQAGRYLLGIGLLGIGLPCIKSKSPAFDSPVAINAKDFSVYESLSAAMEPLGIATLWVQPARRVDQKVSSGIWDGSQLDEKELQRLTDFCSQVRSHDATVVALLDYPRVEHVAQAQSAGASAVFGKPYVVDELLAALR
ncbi:MAG: hypothetical protein GXP28_09990 [Planctomycetes bacterium]|nr:hypothetical protein [Planctomycetota bacterium]